MVRSGLYGIELFCEQIAYALLGIAVGVAVGAIGGIFGAGVSWFGAYGMENFIVNVWFLPCVGILTVAMMRHCAPKNGTGMGALFKASRGESDGFPLRNIVFQFAGAWPAHMCCASVGREGAGIQIGAAIGNMLGKNIPLHDADKILLVAGMAAGFTALFGTPVCSLFFALEVTVVGGIHLRALVAALFASFAANFSAAKFGAAAFTREIAYNFNLDISMFFRLFLFGAMCGIAGLIFCEVRKYAKKFFSKSMPNEYVRVAAVGLFLSCMMVLFQGRYSGAGSNLLEGAFEGDIQTFDWLLKLVFTALFLSIGFIGGEVTSFFSSGACLGALVASWFGLPIPAAAALGCAAVFGAATNTLLAPVVLGMEMFGGAGLPYMAIVCLAAYLFNFGRSVYNQKIRETVVETFERKLGKKKTVQMPVLLKHSR